MSQKLQAGDYLVFQIESGYCLLRVLEIEGEGDETIWHVAAYSDFYLDVDGAEIAINGGALAVSEPHMALTNRAFESTQVAKVENAELEQSELKGLYDWKNSSSREVADRSVRLLLGLR